MMSSPTTCVYSAVDRSAIMQIHTCKDTHLQNKRQKRMAYEITDA